MTAGSLVGRSLDEEGGGISLLHSIWTQAFFVMSDKCLRPKFKEINTAIVDGFSCKTSCE